MAQAAACWAATAWGLMEILKLRRKYSSPTPEAFPVHPYPREAHEQRALSIHAVDKKQRGARPVICDNQKKHGRSSRQVMDDQSAVSCRSQADLKPIQVVIRLINAPFLTGIHPNSDEI